MKFKCLDEARKIRFGNLQRALIKLGLSKSGFYKYVSRKNLPDVDLKDGLLIGTIHHAYKEKAGAQTIKMILEDRHGIVMNLKKIRRLKIKYGYKTKIRRSKVEIRNRRKEEQENKTYPNILNREFKRNRPDEVYVTDVTQLNYGHGKKAFLAVFKDLCTKEIISYSLSKKADVNLVDLALEKALGRLTKSERSKLMIHSDQGFQFTSKQFTKKLLDNGVIQSMSRRGNCYDNACVESFFGHFKDWLEITRCASFENLEEIVTREMDFYNNVRPQWGLNKKPPRLYRGLVLNSLRLF